MKKTILPLFLLAFLFLIPIAKTITPITTCQDITISGSYALQNSISTSNPICMTISASNVDLALNAFTISKIGYSGSGTGAINVEGNNVTIHDGTLFIPSGDWAIYINSHNSTMKNLILNGSGYGIFGGFTNSYNLFQNIIDNAGISAGSIGSDFNYGHCIVVDNFVGSWVTGTYATNSTISKYNLQHSVLGNWQYTCGSVNGNNASWQQCPISDPCHIIPPIVVEHLISNDCHILPTSEISNQGFVMYLFAGGGLLYDTLFCNPLLLQLVFGGALILGTIWAIYKKWMS
jgi:hypothetical protein